MSETFGQVLSGLRKERKLSLRALSTKTSYSHVYLWQIEHGEKPVTPDVADACDRALEAGGELLALAGTSPAGQSTAVVTPADPSRIRGLSEARDRFERLYRTVGGVAVRPRITEHVRLHALPMLEATQCPQNGETKGQATSAVAELAALAGLCAHDSLDMTSAGHHIGHAWRLAQQSGDVATIGYVLSLCARLEVWNGRPSAALEHIDRALRMQSRLTTGLCADLHCLRAEVYGRTGDSKPAMDAMLEAYRLIDRLETDTGSVSADVRFMQSGHLMARRADVLRRLGTLDEATAYARAALVFGRRVLPRGQANRLIVLARILIAAGELDEAAAVGGEVLQLVEPMESTLLWHRIAGLRQACADVTADFCARADDALRSRR